MDNNNKSSKTSNVRRSNSPEQDYELPADDGVVKETTNPLRYFRPSTQSPPPPLPPLKMTTANGLASLSSSLRSPLKCSPPSSRSPSLLSTDCVVGASDGGSGSGSGHPRNSYDSSNTTGGAAGNSRRAAALDRLEEDGRYHHHNLHHHHHQIRPSSTSSSSSLSTSSLPLSLSATAVTAAASAGVYGRRPVSDGSGNSLNKKNTASSAGSVIGSGGGSGSGRGSLNMLRRKKIVRSASLEDDEEASLRRRSSTLGSKDGVSSEKAGSSAGSGGRRGVTSRARARDGLPGFSRSQSVTDEVSPMRSGSGTVLQG